jgi:phosphoserine phosphatase RsbU/P
MTPGSKPVRVLIVDDEPDIEALIRQRFRKRLEEFNFVFARNGEEALQRLFEDPELALVITDINMPVMDGLALLERLNGLDGRLVKAVILSAYGDMRNIRAAMNGGAFDFLTKPLDFRDFEKTIRRTQEALDATRRGIQAREELAALEQELEIAARIQASILPRDSAPRDAPYEIFAEMKPARQVGGDFYDFFAIGEHRLGFVIGDVSGKGIPAALYMAVCRTLLRATALQNLSPGECLEYANHVLYGQGEAGVFVTVFYGILHTDTGLVEYAIAGHNPPYRISAGLERIEKPGGAVAGLLPGLTYETGALSLVPGDSIFLFTDGVTESMNGEGRFFGERRLCEALGALRSSPPEEMVRGALRAVDEFSTGAPQADDVTAMAVKWAPARTIETGIDMS